MTDQPAASCKPTGLRPWLEITVRVALLARLLLLLCYRPIAYSDTNSYWRLAGSVRAASSVTMARARPATRPSWPWLALRRLPFSCR